MTHRLPGHLGYALNANAARRQLQPKCSSCGNPEVWIGHGDGDLLCTACETMRLIAAAEEAGRLAGWWTPDRCLRLILAQAGRGVAPLPPRRIFR